ncbi:MAG: Phosphate acyltransferase [Holosporales bacterium]
MTYVIAIDTAGGDHAPCVIVSGVKMALERHLIENPSVSVHFLLYGDPDKILPAYDDLLKKYATIVPCLQYIENDAKPSHIIRSGLNTTLGKAVMAVADGTAQAVVSGGNTGAFMALSKIYLKTFEGIDRPAIPGLIPTQKGKSLMLDLGANIECTPKMLLQFALMGRVYLQSFLQCENPTVGLLNVGAEQSKGRAHLKEAAELFAHHPLINYIGFVEGTDILKGTVDIIVTDGFTGNVALKSIEGTLHFLMQILKKALSSSLLGKLAYIIAQPVVKKVLNVLDKRRYNGAIFLGVKGVAVKSHGSSDDVAFSYAVEGAIKMAVCHLPQKIEAQLKNEGV